MNILLIPSWYPSPEKPELGIFIQKHAQLIAKEHHVTVLYFDYNVPGTKGFISTTTETLHEKLQVKRIFINTKWLPFAGIVKLKFTLLAYWYYIILKKQVKYELVNLNVVYHIGLFLFPFLYYSKKPLVITEHWTGYFDQDGAYNRLGSLSRRMMQALFRKSVRVIAISQSLKRRLDYLFRTGDKTEVVPNVLNVPDGPRPKEGLDPNHFDFLVIGNFNNRQKGLTGILDALAEVRRTYPQARLTMAGDGADFELVKQHAHKLGFTDEVVRFPGRVANHLVPELYKKAHCYILNSNFETFSISTAEAILNGVPVIATRCNGPEEYVNTHNGILIKVGDTAELAQAMTRMIGDFEYKENELYDFIVNHYVNEIQFNFFIK